MNNVDILVEKFEDETFVNEDVKGLTEDDLRDFVNKTAIGGISIKAIVFQELKKFIKEFV